MTEHFSDNGHEEVVQTSSSVSSLPDLMSVFHRRKMHLLVGAVIGLLLGVIFYVVSPKRYESTAQILVEKKQAERPIDNPTGSPVNNAMIQPDFLETHRAVLRSTKVVGEAIQEGHLNSLQSLEGEESLMDTITKNLKVERDFDKKSPTSFTSQVLNVSFRGKSPDDCGLVVAAILDSYKKFLDETTQGSVKETLDLIKKARKLVEDDLDRKEKEYAVFRQNTHVLWKINDTGITLYQQRLGNIDLQRAAYMRQHAEIKVAIAAADDAWLWGGGPLEALEILNGFEPGTAVVSSRAQSSKQKDGPKDSMDVVPSNSPDRTTLVEEFVHLQLEERRESEVFGPNHPHVRELQDRLATFRVLLYPGAAKSKTKLNDRTLQFVNLLVNAKISQLKQQLAEAERGEKALDTLFQKELVVAKNVFPYETQDDFFKHSIERSRSLYDSLLKRIDDLDLVSNVGGYNARTISAPQPGEKVWPLAFLVFPVALLLGLMGGFGFGYLAEMADKSFRTPEEIRRSLGVPIIGHIPLLKMDAAILQKIEEEGGDVLPSVCAHYRPKSREAEAYRGVRTALYFSTRGGGYKVIQITSPDMGDGKSTLTANLAVSLAQSGKRVLVVDADLRRPQQHDIFGVSSTVGFSSVLMGTAEPTDAIVATCIPNLSLMPSGTLPPNPAELLTSARLKEVLDYLSERFDMVLIDTPPLLAVTDPSVVSPRVDGVLLTFRLGKESRPHAQRAKEILDTLGAKVLGVVVNAIDPRDKSASYGYGYGSKYGGYGYGYGYGYYAGNNRYYEENGESKPDAQHASQGDHKR